MLQTKESNILLPLTKKLASLDMNAFCKLSGMGFEELHKVKKIKEGILVLAIIFQAII